MRRCETCKHWEPPTPTRERHGLCWHIEDGDGIPKDSKSPAYVEADIITTVSLRTLPTFGCVLHEGQ